MADVLTVEGVGKKFCQTIGQAMKYGAADMTREFLGIPSKTEQLRPGEFWALDDITFDISDGETLGLIGLNGSGKSTLLKLLNGIYLPDRGRIEISGRVGALIEVGAGFHPMLTGRENIYVNGAILGLTKHEIRSKFDSIVQFAELDKFIDVPVRNYSSGMYVRLGFSVAVHCEPEVLLIDEVLAVGDLSFRNKCIAKINELKDKTTTVFVSHDMNQVKRLCDRVVVIDKSRIVFDGGPEDAIHKYQTIADERQAQSSGRAVAAVLDDRIAAVDVDVVDAAGESRIQFGSGEDVIFRFAIESACGFEDLVMGTIVKSGDENWIGGHNGHGQTGLRIEPGRNVIEYRIAKDTFCSGNYRIGFKWKTRDNKILFRGSTHLFAVDAGRDVNAARYGHVQLNDSWRVVDEAQA